MKQFAQQYFAEAAALWDRFWFRPQAPHTLAAIRIATGAMLLYTHIIWGKQLTDFLGPDAWVEKEILPHLHLQDYVWSYLWHFDSPSILWTHHLVTLIVMASLMIGCFTRVVAPLAWLLQLMYMHRLTGALFGLDQMTTMLAMYLMLSSCGSVWSVDAWLRNKGKESSWWLPDARPTVANNIATRLLQLHLCVIYLFGGVGKMRGEMWWDGTAMWFAVSNYEYQSLDMTWIAAYPVIFAGLSHLTVFWEAFYCALVWPKLTRPFVVATAFMVHGGIAISLGMITFGVIMIVANCIFISPAVFGRIGARFGGASRTEPAGLPIPDSRKLR